MRSGAMLMWYALEFPVLARAWHIVETQHIFSEHWKNESELSRGNKAQLTSI